MQIFMISVQYLLIYYPLSMCENYMINVQYVHEQSDILVDNEYIYEYTIACCEYTIITCTSKSVSAFAGVVCFMEP